MSDLQSLVPAVLGVLLLAIVSFIILVQLSNVVADFAHHRGQNYNRFFWLSFFLTPVLMWIIALFLRRAEQVDGVHSRTWKFAQWMKKIKAGTTLFLVFLVGIWSIPTVGLIITSFRAKDEAAASGWWEAVFSPFTQNWSLDAYKHVLGLGEMTSNATGMGEAFINTLVVTIPATLLPILIAANAAYAFTFLEFKGKEIYFSILVGLMVVPLQAALVPILNAMKWLNKNWHIDLIGDYPGAWIVHSAFALPLAIYIFRNYMLTLPVALIEAARVDGASYYQIFWKLVVPMSMPALASFAIFQFLWVWNDYLIAFIFVGEQKPVMTYKINLLLGQYGDGWLNVTAASFLSLIVPLAVFFGLQRFFVRGLTSGSVK